MRLIRGFGFPPGLSDNRAMPQKREAVERLSAALTKAMIASEEIPSASGVLRESERLAAQKGAAEAATNTKQNRRVSQIPIVNSLLIQPRSVRSALASAAKMCACPWCVLLLLFTTRTIEKASFQCSSPLPGGRAFRRMWATGLIAGQRCIG